MNNVRKINPDQKLKKDPDNNKPHPYEINTQTIFLFLTNRSDIYFDKEKWRKFDRTFLVEAVQNAMKLTLRSKNITTAKYDGTKGMGDYLKNYEKRRYPAHLELAEDSDNFPFPDYFLEYDEKSLHEDEDGNPYMNIISFSEPCVVKKEDNYFELFFALQFSLTDIVQGIESQANDFLSYHLQNTFANDFQKFKDFLENLCLEYNEFLKDKYEPLAKRFIENAKSQNKIEEDINEKAVINSDNKPKLKWCGSPSQFGYLFLELAKNGFIDLPPTNAQGSYNKYAKTCWDLFDFQTKTTLENLQKEMNPKKNTLSDGVRIKFTIPELNDIGKKTK